MLEAIENRLGRAVEFSTAIVVGVFAAASIWLWLDASDNLVLSVMINGLRTCF